MSGMHGMGATWRHLRSDRSVVDSKLDRGTVRRVLSFARPHRTLITGFIALTVIDATSAAAGIDFEADQADVYYFAPQKNLASDGGIWLALFSPAAIERVERIAASGRYIPEFLSLKNAIDNSRLNQTLNTPAVSTLLLMENQIDWINSNGGLAWASARTTESSARTWIGRSWTRNQSAIPPSRSSASSSR